MLMACRTLGILYELIGERTPSLQDPADFDVEYEPLTTIEALEESIEALGYAPERLGSPRDLLQAFRQGREEWPDAVLNISEGQGSRNREAWGPVLLEMLGIPTLGSDALTLSLSLDKAWTRDVVAAAGILVPSGLSVGTREEIQEVEKRLRFPLFVKPRWEGTAKGIHPSSRVETLDALEEEVDRICDLYRQPALVEEFLPGAEYTVTVVGNSPVRSLPVLQRALEVQTGIGLHAIEESGSTASELDHHLPGDLNPVLEFQLQQLGIRVFQALECRDFARADFRLNADGVPYFLEINPLPTFAPEGSFGILAELEGKTYSELVSPILREGLQRIGVEAE